MAPFTLAADIGTDLWKKPPSTDDSNAPTRTHSKAPLEDLRSASTTFTTSYTTQFDQAGIVLRLTNAATSAVKWVKAGVEFYEDEPRLSVVACDRWADWSVAPLPSNLVSDIRQGKHSVTVLAEKVGVALWIFYVEGGVKTPLREIAWFYSNEGDCWEVEVGALVARPDKEVTGALEVKFDALDVEWEKK